MNNNKNINSCEDITYSEDDIISKFNESTIIPFYPKTIKNNCLNLKCLDNIQKLKLLKEKYKNFEKKYFDCELNGKKKCEEYNELLLNKKNILNKYEKLYDIYNKHQINNLNYYQLKNLEAKIMSILNNYKIIKNKKLKEKTKGNMYGKKYCVVCFENEINMLLKPCNHLCTCENCTKKIDSCPMCRKKIKEINKIKYSYTY